MRVLTLVARVPADNNGSYMTKIRQVISNLSELDFKVLLFVEQGEVPELLVLGDVIDLSKSSVRDIVRKILKYASLEVSDPEMLDKLAGAALNECGELAEQSKF